VAALIFGYPLLSQERVKLWTSNLASTFTEPIRIKAHKNLGEMDCGRIQGLPNFLGVPPFISGTGKATDFKFCRIIHMVDRNKSPWEILGSRGRSQGAPKISRAPTHRAHCAVCDSTAFTWSSALTLHIDIYTASRGFPATARLLALYSHCIGLAVHNQFISIGR